MNNTSIQ